MFIVITLVVITVTPFLKFKEAKRKQKELQKTLLLKLKESEHKREELQKKLNNPITELKSEAKILVNQLRDFASLLEAKGSDSQDLSHYEKYDMRFVDRVKTVRKNLDAQGKHSDKLNELSGDPQWTLSYPPIVAKLIREMAYEIERLSDEL